MLVTVLVSCIVSVQFGSIWTLVQLQPLMPNELYICTLLRCDFWCAPDICSGPKCNIEWELGIRHINTRNATMQFHCTQSRLTHTPRTSLMLPPPTLPPPHSTNAVLFYSVRPHVWTRIYSHASMGYVNTNEFNGIRVRYGYISFAPQPHMHNDFISISKCAGWKYTTYIV